MISLAMSCLRKQEWKLKQYGSIGRVYPTVKKKNQVFRIVETDVFIFQIRHRRKP